MAEIYSNIINNENNKFILEIEKGNKHDQNLNKGKSN